MPIGVPLVRPQRCGMLANALVSKGHKVLLWTSAFDHLKKSHLHKTSERNRVSDLLSVQFIRASGYNRNVSLKRIANNQGLAKEFARLASLSEVLPDIIYVPVPLPELAEKVIDLSKPLGIPTVVDIRDPWPAVYLTLFPRWTHRLIRLILFKEFHRMKKVVKSATMLTAVSQTYFDWAIITFNRTPRTGDQAYPLGFPQMDNSLLPVVKEKTLEIINKYQLTQNDIMLCFAGTFGQSCNLRTIIKAAKILNESSHKNILFVLIGSGDNEQKFKTMADGTPNILFTGWLDLISMKAWLELSNVGLIPYFNNATPSLPNKPFEYMAAGLPILSSLDGELKTLIGNNQIGRYYQSDSVSSLLEQIEWFSNNLKQAKNMGRRAKKLWLEKYQSEAIYSKLVEQFEKLIA